MVRSGTRYVFVVRGGLLLRIIVPPSIAQRQPASIHNLEKGGALLLCVSSDASAIDILSMVAEKVIYHKSCAFGATVIQVCLLQTKMK